MKTAVEISLLLRGMTPNAHSQSTFIGADPDVMESAPEEPFVPTTRQPTPIDTPPNSISVSPGNTGLSDQQL